VRRILVTGMSGTGKSSALAELARRGSAPLTPTSRAERSRTPRVGRTDYVSGTVSNQGRFYDRFDAVVLLSAPADVLLERIAMRSTNEYGKSQEKQELVLTYLREVEPRLRATCTHEIDASSPLEEVVERPIEIGEAR
jgi:dephospho-CoA kinase